MASAATPGLLSRLIDWDDGVYSRLWRWFADRPLLADAILAAVATALAFGGMLAVHPIGTERSADAIGFALAIGGHAPLVWRRRAPVNVLLVIAVCTWMFWVLDYRTNFDGGLVLAFYAAMAHEPSRRRAWAAAAGVGVVSLGVIVVGIISSQDDVNFGTFVAVLTLFGIAIAMGDNMRHRRAYQAELQARAERAEADREAERLHAVEEERARIARELHDVVAHSMSVMVVQAGAARRVLDTKPDQASAALANIEAAGRESLTEMRRVLGILRTPDHTAELAPQPTVEQFGELVDQCAEAGLDVELVIKGDVRKLAAGVELASFRIVQEALTNVLKHGGAVARATVTLDYRPDALVVEIVDDGRGAASDPPPPGSGNGLLGMRERVDLFGGELDAGPRAGGGFRVNALLPADPRSKPVTTA